MLRILRIDIANSLFYLIKTLEIKWGLGTCMCKYIKMVIGFCIFINLQSLNAQINISTRKGSIKLFPCLECHKNIQNNSTLKQQIHDWPPSHQAIQFKHMKTVKECSICHFSKNLNHLTNLDGIKIISFDESFKLCLQCHGEKTKEFEMGIHGKQVGKWSGAKVRFNCVECHDPHSPKIRPMFAFPPPKFPKFGIRKGDHK